MEAPDWGQLVERRELEGDYRMCSYQMGTDGVGGQVKHEAREALDGQSKWGLWWDLGVCSGAHLL